MTGQPGTFPASLLLAGAGKMGGALLQGWLRAGLDGRQVVVIDPYGQQEVLAAFAEQGVTINPALENRPAAEVLVLAVKPQALSAAAPTLQIFAGSQTLIVSIIAGKTIDDLSRAFPHVSRFARVMPNTPAAVGRGISGVVATEAVSPAQKGQIDLLLSAVGQVEWLGNESLIDAVTAVSGSGPAYVFYLTECLAKAGEAAGLDPHAAMRLARATVEGAGALMASQADTAPEILRQNVTSPGGTTAAALEVLMRDDRLLAAMTEAVAAALRRARALAG